MNFLLSFENFLSEVLVARTIFFFLLFVEYANRTGIPNNYQQFL